MTIAPDSVSLNSVPEWSIRRNRLLYIVCNCGSTLNPNLSQGQQPVTHQHHRHA
jgi:hypothetical protein